MSFRPRLRDGGAVAQDGPQVASIEISTALRAVWIMGRLNPRAGVVTWGPRATASDRVVCEVGGSISRLLALAAAGARQEVS